MPTATETPLIEALQTVPAFQGLTADQFEWLAANATDRRFAAGELLVEAGAPADEMIIILEGEILGHRPGGESIYSAGAGTVTGMLPYSRMKQYPNPVRATIPTRIATIHRDRFDDMFRHIPDMQGRLVGILTDRVRESARNSQQRDKLAALGKLSAGLAHELNNPASAVQRSVGGLRDALATLRDANLGLCRENLSDEVMDQLAKIEAEVAQEMSGSPVMDALARSDREDHIASLLEKRGIARPWELAPSLVEAEADDFCLIKMGEQFPGKTLDLALRRLAATIEVEKILRQIESASVRISDLVKAIKEYTYMDQVGEKETDLHEGLESTLTMLHHDLKKGINVKRDYDRSLPHICARGSELNQVWTNLIDNAIDAIKGAAKEGQPPNGNLLIRTAREDGYALVEIVDDGPGIPQDVQDRIFDPFFTTKPVGEGTGLGLDTAYRIVRQHQGNIRLESRPGETRFQVRLPLRKGAAK